MSTFSQDKPTNARNATSSVDKDKATKEDIAAAEASVTDQANVPADEPNKPTALLNETADEAADRHVASTELPVGDVTDPATQAKSDDDDDGEDDWDSSEAEDAAEKIVPGAAVGPQVDGTVRNDAGHVAYAPPGSMNAAVNGVQQDASGHVDSVGTDNSNKSGTRV